MRRDFAVSRGTVAHLAFARQPLDRALEQRAEADETLPLRAQLQQLLLQLVAEVDLRGELERERRVTARRLPDLLGIRDLDEPAEDCHRLLDLGVGRAVVVVLERLDLRRAEGATLRLESEP